MSWRGSTGHIDSNVPDYQKMLQGRSSSSGWSSTQPSLTSYSSRFPGASASYLSPRNPSNLARPGSSGGSYSNSYQPSKYGLAAESSYHGHTGASNYRGLPAEENARRPDNGYTDNMYGFVGREFDLEPYRSAANRGTDYSSDSGRGQASRRNIDYSSDSGMSFRRHSGRSSDFDLEIPSPDTSRNQHRSQHSEAAFSSPVKSKMQPGDYFRYSDNQAGFSEPQSRAGQLADYKNLSRSEPNLEHYHDNHDDIKQRPESGEGSPRMDDSHEHLPEAGTTEPGERDLSSNFTSPQLYHGEIADLTVMQHNKMSKSKLADMTRWQQKQTSTVLKEPGRHALHPHIFQKETYRDNPHDTTQSDTEISPRDTREHLSPRHHDKPSPRDLSSSHYSSAGHGAQGNLRYEKYGSGRPQYADHMNHIQSAADAIIRDKDTIIDGLRERILTLEDLVKESEMKLRRTHMSHAGHTEDRLTFTKMQEMEYHNAELRTDLANLKLQKQTEVEDLEIKLGGVEHEVVQLKSALQKAQPNTVLLKKQLEQKEAELEEWQRKAGVASERFEHLKEKVEGMERYLADLPTLEEFTKNAEDLAQCSEELKLKKEQVCELEKRLSDTSQHLYSRETTIQELENKQRQVSGKMRELTLEMQRVRSQGEGKLLSETQEELAETREMKDKVTHDLEKAKKFLEKNHRLLRQMEGKHAAESRQLQERLSQEEEAVIALREEARVKDEQVNKLKKSLKQYANKNQDLMDEGLVMKERLRHLENTSVDETQKLQRQFVREMSMCFMDLRSLVQILVQQAEGKDPNVSLLLGTRASLDDEAASGSSMNDVESLKHWFSKLRDLHQEVDEVRNLICNKYAKDMGDNLNCATQ